MNTGCLCQINSFVVGNGSFFFGRISANGIIAIDMDKSLITEESVVFCLGNSTVAVNDNNIGVAVIEGVTIGESVIYIQYRMITDSIAERIPVCMPYSFTKSRPPRCIILWLE